jgi:hypothetical protein
MYILILDISIDAEDYTQNILRRIVAILSNKLRLNTMFSYLIISYIILITNYINICLYVYISIQLILIKY